MKHTGKDFYAVIGAKISLLHAFIFFAEKLHFVIDCAQFNFTQLKYKYWPGYI